jgi:hypothetical protein
MSKEVAWNKLTVELCNCRAKCKWEAEVALERRLEVDTDIELTKPRGEKVTERVEQ